MDYLNCKDLPLWAQILVGVVPERSADAEEKEQNEAEKVIAERAHAA
jgi:hypothetical protein